MCPSRGAVLVPEDVMKFLAAQLRGNVRELEGALNSLRHFARVTGRPGVLVTTSGPGITNAVTALATAYADSVPVLAVSPHAKRPGTDVLPQESVHTPPIM